MNQNEIPTPELTLDPAPEQPVSAQTILAQADPAQKTVPEPQLTPAEQKMVDDFAAKIDLTNSNQILQYGAGTQKKMADFSESALGKCAHQGSWAKSGRCSPALWPN